MGLGCGGMSVTAAKSTRCSCSGSPQQGQTGSGSRTSIGGAVHWSGVGRVRKVKSSLARLASRAFGLGLALPLGEGGGLSLRVPLVLIELGLQGGVLRQEFLDPGFQRGEFREQRGDERQQALFAQPCEFFERRHDADM